MTQLYCMTRPAIAVRVLETSWAAHMKASGDGRYWAVWIDPEEAGAWQAQGWTALSWFEATDLVAARSAEPRAVSHRAD